MTAASVYNSIELGNLVGSFNGGLGGAPVMLRASQRSKAKMINFTYKSGAAQVAGDQIVVARLFPTDYFMDWMLNITGTAPGSNILINWGKYDPNSATNTNAAFDSAIPAANLGLLRPGYSLNTGAVASNTLFEATTTSNLPLQVGTDPAGDLTANQGIPNFGSQLINIFFQLYNGAAANQAQYQGYILIGSGQ